MRILIFGSQGFLGQAVTKELEEYGHEVVRGVAGTSGKRINLLNLAAVEACVQASRPEVIINCAGIVAPGEDFDDNVRFTENIIKAAASLENDDPKVIVTGSAAEYGEVKNLPVHEDTPLNATSPYALSKIHEEEAALKLAHVLAVPIIIVRVFNPLGSGMKERYLIPSLMRQTEEFLKGRRQNIEVTRLDAARDYIDVRDIARAYRLLVEGTSHHYVYNVGSGRSTSNKEILDMLLKSSRLEHMPSVVETSAEAEKLIACQADISRIKTDLGWLPEINLEQTIKDISHAKE